MTSQTYDRLKSIGGVLLDEAIPFIVDVCASYRMSRPYASGHFLDKEDAN